MFQFKKTQRSCFMESGNHSKNGTGQKNRLNVLRFALTLTLTLFVSVSFAGDVLTLNNEMIFSGKVTKINDCTVIFKSDGNKYQIPASEIFSIQFEDVEDKVYTDYVQMANDNPDKCLKGRLDAELYHGKKGGHFVLGVLFGPFAMIGTALANPTPEKGRQTYMMSENKDIFNDIAYLSCYRKKAKLQLVGAEGLGWAAWLILALTI